MDLKLYYPVRQPINPSNLFGANPTEYAPQKGHPGNDFEAPLGTPIFAPCDGSAFFVGPDKDGGCGFWIRTPSNADIQYTIILWHMPPKGDPTYTPIIPEDGTVVPVTAGQLIGHTGNSGYRLESTGPHLHVGVMPCDSTGAALEPENGFEGCVDPAPFFSGEFAEDISIKAAVVEKSAAVVSLVAQATDQQVPHQEKLNILQQIEVFIKTFLP